MDRATFAAHLNGAATAAHKFAGQFLEEALPEAFIFRVRLNASYDGHATPDFALYPTDASPVTELDRRGVVDVLYRDGRVPQWIDIQVVAETGDATIIELLACGRFTDDDNKLYYSETEWAPFGVKGPTLPYPYVEGQRFSLYHWASARSVAQLARIEQHASKVRFLELVGPAFGDRVVASIGQLPALGVCELRDMFLTGGRPLGDHAVAGSSAPPRRDDRPNDRPAGAGLGEARLVLHPW